MTVEFLCPHCNAEQKADLSAETALPCRNCHQPVSLTISEKIKNAGQIDHCAVCGNTEFYLQKDFNPRLGLLIFALGVLFSYHTKFISLFVATAIDFVLYYVLPTVTICYQCRAIYRGFKENPEHQGFNHLKALKYVPKSQPNNLAQNPNTQLTAGGIAEKSTP
jgi:hypothetical protein